MKKQSRFYEVAGITIEVTSDYPISENTFHPKFKLFETHKPGNDNVKINHHFHLPELPGDLKKFEIFNDKQWKVYKTTKNWIYCYQPFFPGDPEHNAIGIFNLDHTQVDVYITNIDKKKYINAKSLALTFLNSDQILFSKLLCDRQGLILHSNGFNINGQGILLVGKSGVGKSTLSKMLKQKGYEILCDDRMFILNRKGACWLSGHWCHGSIIDVSNISVPLKAILFLEQAMDNEISLIKNSHLIVQNIIQAMIKSFFIKKEWEKTFVTIEELTQKVQSYNLKFDLSGKICNIIEKKMIE